MAETQDYRQVLTDKLIEQLEAGTAPWQKPWDAKAGISRLPYNPTTGKEYRGANSLYLSMHGHNDPRWATYKQAVAAGWQVRKGQKGALVEYWKFREEKLAVDDNGKPILDEHGKQKTVSYELDKPRLFRAVVFNAEQMDGVPELTKEPRKYEWDPAERAEKILESSGAKIYHDQNDRAFYSPMADEIHMPGKGQFPNQGAYYSTALHELGHWTGHDTRLGRDLSGGFGSESYAKEELRAELSSYFMADKLGIPHDPGQHASYVKSWIKGLKEDKNEIFRAAKDAEQITEYVLQLDINRDIAKDSGRTIAGVDGKAIDGSPLQPVSEADAAKEARKAAELDVSGLGPKTIEKTMLVVPFKEKDTAKAAGAKWDKEAKAWYAPPGTALDGISKWIATPDQSQSLPAPVKPWHEMPFAEFVAGTTATKLVDAGRDFQVFKDGTYLGLTDAVTPEEAIRSTHRRLVNNALWGRSVDSPWAADPNFQGMGGQPSMPPAAVIAEYPDLQEKFAEVIKAHTPPEKQWLAVPFKEKDAAREAGAKWDKDAKAWYAPAGVEAAKVAKWIPTADLGQVRADPAVSFGNAIRAAGLVLDGEPVMDGKLQRVPLENGKKGNRDGAYVGYLDGRPAGHIQNFVTGEKSNWKLEGPDLSAADRAALAAQSLINKQARAAKLGVQHEEAAGKAQGRWDKAKDMVAGETTPYLERKQVAALGVRRDGDNLLVPVRDIDGKLWAIQTVFPEKKELVPGTDPLDKVFTKDARKEGNFHMIGEVKPGQPVITVEGYATGASVHQATGYAVAVAFDSGNLDAVVGSLKSRYPTNPHFIGADDDRFPKPGQPVKNAGLTKAIEAASRHDVGVIVPAFSGDGKHTDFNDLHVTEGLQVVQAQVEKGVSQAMALSREAAGALAVERLGADAEVKQPGTNTRHTGTVLDVSGYHATQATSSKVATVHQVKDLEKVPVAGQVATIQYKDGRGKVSEKKVEKQKEIQR